MENMDIRKDLAERISTVDVDTLSEEEVIKITNILTKNKSKKKTEQVVHNTDLFMNDVMEFNPLAVLVCDELGKIIKVNKAAVELFHASPIGYSFFTNLLVDLTELKNKIASIQQGNIEKFAPFWFNPSSFFPGAINKEMCTITFIYPVYNNKKIIINYVVIIEDVTIQKETEDLLIKKEERLRHIVENIQAVYFEVDLNGRIIEISQSVEKFTNYTRQELIGINMADMYENADDRETMINKIFKESKIKDYQIIIKNKDNTKIYASINAELLKDEDNKPQKIIGSVLNVSTLVRTFEALKKSENKFREIFENAPLGILTADTNGNIIEINEKLLQMLGSSSIEETKKINLLSFKPIKDAGIVNAFKKCIETGNPTVLESVYTSIWGKVLNVRIYVKAFKNKHNKVTSFQVMAEDISEEKESERKMLAAINEKEILLREIHHRVKNNMQIIISLINMQMHEINDEFMIRKYRDLQQRVRTMSFIHEDLYISEDISKINFKSYLEKLCDNLSYVYSCNSNICLKYKFSDMYLSIENAIPLGLIANELLSNAFKHAFPKDWIENSNKKCEIEVELNKTKDYNILKISDNGAGMPHVYKPENNNTLGLTLVEILVNQLKGEIIVNNTNGMCYKIIINKKME